MVVWLSSAGSAVGRSAEVCVRAVGFGLESSGVRLAH